MQDRNFKIASEALAAKSLVMTLVIELIDAEALNPVSFKQRIASLADDLGADWKGPLHKAVAADLREAISVIEAGLKDAS